MNALRVGLVGLGAMGRNHARVLGSLDGVELVGIADPVSDARSFEGAPVVGSAEDLLALGLDGWVIAAPTSEHEHLGLLAAEHGVATLIEKPLAPTAEAAERLADRFAEAGVLGVVGHIERFNPAAMALQDRLRGGELGDLYQFVTRRQGPFPARIRDVGVIMDLATHDIDLTGWVTGQAYASVDAWTSHKSGREHEDLVVAVGELESGLIVSHHVNWLSPQKERVTIATGERGTLVADTLNADLYFHENAEPNQSWDARAIFRGVGEGNLIRYRLDRREPLRAELEAFRDAMLGTAPPIAPFSEGANVVRIAERMLRTASTRHRESPAAPR